MAPTPLFTKTETPTEITYTGINEAAGRSHVIKKDDANLDIHVIVPINSMPAPQTWQDVAAALDLHI